MTPADRALLARAAELHRPLARAARSGRWNGLGYAVFGCLSLLLASMDLDMVGIALGAFLLAVGLGERAQAARLLRADGVAARRLVQLELALLGAIALYGILGLTVLPSSGEALQRQLHGLGGSGVDIRRLAHSIDRAWYASVIAVALLYQGGMALHFHRRRRDVERYLREVPAWARDVVQSMAR